MKSYTNMFKTIVQSGQQYLRGGVEQAKQPIIKIDKANTIMEAKCFNDPKIDPKKCIQILSKLLFLMSQGQPFTKQQASQIFFSITKLFQTDDLNLRRLLYLLIKQSKNQDSIFVVTGILVKDLQSKLPSVKRNSLKTIPLVLDPSSFSQIQRYIRTDISDPDPGISSAALLSSNQIYKTHQQMVRKWSPQVSQKLKSNDPQVQYFSLALLGQIKKKDSNFLRKSLFSYMKAAPVGIAVIQHLRMLNVLLKNADYQSNEAVEFKNYVLRQVRSPDDSIVIEAAKIASESHLFSNTDLRDVVKILQTYLASESTVKKYSVLKMYNSLLKNSSRRSLILNVKEIEKVLKDKNLSLSSTAASILLRICSQGYLQKLFNQIDNTMKEMSNDYKVDVVKSLVNVLKTYPKQYGLVNNFLLSIMQKEQSDDVKKQVVQVMRYQVSELGGTAKTQCIQELARFLGYAKNQKIHFQILGIISRQAQKQDITSQLLKNIIHQVYLQQGSIRACGLSTLIKISKINKQKGKMLQKTIDKFRLDSDHQVRQRILFQQTKKPLSNYQLDVIEGYLFNNCQQIQTSKNKELLNFQNMKKWGQEVGSKLLKKKKQNSKVDIQKQSQQQEQRYRELFSNHSTFKNYGVLRKVNKSIRITDPQADGLQVQVRMFLFDNHLIAQFMLQNKFDETDLQNIYIELKHSQQSFLTQHTIPSKLISRQAKGQCYVGLVRCQQCTYLLPQQTMSSVVKFTAKQFSGTKLKATYQDEVSLQNFQLQLSTYMSYWYLDGDQFDKQWQNFKVQTKQNGFQLNFANKQAAVQQLKKLFGMKVVSLQQSGIKIKMKLAGKYLGVHKTLFLLTIAFDTKTGCLLNIQAKSQIQKLIEELTGPMCDDDQQ